MFKTQRFCEVIFIYLIWNFINQLNGEISPYERKCGTISSFGTPYIASGKFVNASKVPWHVGIYEKKLNTYEHICGGSIIGERIIISAAHCFYDDTIRSVKNASLYRIVAGKYYRNYYANETNEVQQFDIFELKIPVSYESYVTQYTSDIALVVLNVSVRITSQIKPICLNFNDDDIEVQPNSFGRVAGWGEFDDSRLPSGELRAIDLPAVSTEHCRKNNMKYLTAITNDKFCVSNVNGSTVCLGDSGGGFAISKTINNIETYFLRGIVSVALNIENKCGGNYYTTFTNVGNYEIFVRHYLKHFNILSNRLCRNTSRLEQSITFNVECKHQHMKIPCNETISGSEARLSCKFGYKPKSDFINVLKCNDNAEWDKTPSSCIPECGTISKMGTPLVADGRIVSITEFPWHVGVYRLISDNWFTFICGGTIISEKIILTGAQCIWDIANSRIGNINDFRIAAGKYYQKFEELESLPIQVFNISKIHITPTYSNINTNHLSDIAIIILDRPIQFKTHIKPICLESGEELDIDPPPNTIGKVANWGFFDDTKILSKELRSIELETITNVQCKDMVEIWKNTLTVDKFCTHNLNNSQKNICQGDSGSAFAVPKLIDGIETYYLWGILSIGYSSACGGDYLSAFTNVPKYHYFINPILNRYKMQ